MITTARHAAFSAVDKAREMCGCIGCRGGPRELGAHTIAAPYNPRPTPSSCLAPALLTWLLRNVDDNSYDYGAHSQLCGCNECEVERKHALQGQD